MRLEYLIRFKGVHMIKFHKNLSFIRHHREITDFFFFLSKDFFLIKVVFSLTSNYSILLILGLDLGTKFEPMVVKRPSFLMMLRFNEMY